MSKAFVAIVTTNLPAIFVLVRRWLRPWLPSLLQTRRAADGVVASALTGINNNNLQNARLSRSRTKSISSLRKPPPVSVRQVDMVTVEEVSMNDRVFVHDVERGR